ncbi:MAG: hypothetical protein N2589_06150, partial [bacterium]|nr:hypothetical protein [bacterium]
MITFFKFFLSGLLIGISLCGIHCCFLLFPLVVKGTENRKDGIKIGLFFGIPKILIYGVIGGLVSLVGLYIQNIIERKLFS